MNDQIVYESICKKYDFSADDQKGIWGEWKTARQVASELGFMPVSQRHSRIINKILNYIVVNNGLKSRISSGYPMYYLKTIT